MSAGAGDESAFGMGSELFRFVADGGDDRAWSGDGSDQVGLSVFVHDGGGTDEAASGGGDCADAGDYAVAVEFAAVDNDDAAVGASVADAGVAVRVIPTVEYFQELPCFS